ncbi:MAG TPA: alpha/beta hydrolase-fold protein [Candidatus Acidoferrales bacterium]|nr:alpha/beta hydrolase-fold protein [Candidatus Acidoferrales bacterium]
MILSTQKLALVSIFLAGALTISCTALKAQAASHTLSGPIHLDVDSSRAAQKILHAHLTIPVKPGPLTLVYPEWIPGEHQPSGPIIEMAGLKIMANGKMISWRRDLFDMYALHVDVPAGASPLDVNFDFLLSPNTSGYSAGASATAFLNLVSWNQLVLYPKGEDAANVTVVPTLKVPAGWKFGTALPVTKQGGDTIDFSPVSLETLIDSPVITGRYFRAIDLSPGQTPHHEMDIAADSPADLQMTPETEAAYRQLIVQAFALFGTRHYRDYHFLLTLSDNVAHFGLEHHESSDDRIYEHALTDPTTGTATASLLPHEYVHSWNGKYRRPAGLLSPDYEQPMKDDLLWVYEGLTDYLGQVLATRSGLWTPQQFREQFAREAALLDAEPGREWRPLQDTADAAVFLYDSTADWQNWRRGTDFYQEGDFLWLAVDDEIRHLTEEQKSINDFCRLFHGGTSGEPDLKPYDFEDVVAGLNQVAPYDWTKFLRDRLDSLAPNTMDDALDNSGWKIVYNDDANEIQDKRDKVRKEVELRLSVGLWLKNDGTVKDVIYDGPAYKAGFAPGMKITAVNGRQLDAATIADTIKQAIKDAEHTTEPIRFIAANGLDVETYSVDYHGGLRNPHLVRDESHSDLLSEILKPLGEQTAPSASASTTARPTPPTRDPNTPGFVKAKELADGEVPPPNADGNFIIGPTHSPAAEMTVRDDVPDGTVYNFTVSSADSKIYPGIARDAGTFGTPDPNDAAKLVVTTSHPAPYTRKVAVYVPKEYVSGTAAPFIVGADGPDQALFTVLDNLIAEHKVPAMIAISIGNGSGDAQGSERGLEYDTMSGLYAEWVQKEVLPLVKSKFNVKLTNDPDGRATMGGSSGGSCALIMAWYHPEWYHRVLTYSGTYVNQQWPPNPQTPHGAWEFHEHLIPDGPRKPIRIWMEVGDRDNYNPNVMRDNMHDWVVANENMAKALAAKGYHYQFVFARNAGHTDRSVKQQTLAEALEYLWQDYPKQ